MRPSFITVRRGTDKAAAATTRCAWRPVVATASFRACCPKAPVNIMPAQCLPAAKAGAGIQSRHARAGGHPAKAETGNPNPSCPRRRASKLVMPAQAGIQTRHARAGGHPAKFLCILREVDSRLRGNDEFAQQTLSIVCHITTHTQAGPRRRLSIERQRLVCGELDPAIRSSRAGIVSRPIRTVEGDRPYRAFPSGDRRRSGAPNVAIAGWRMGVLRREISTFGEVPASIWAGRGIPIAGSGDGSRPILI